MYESIGDGITAALQGAGAAAVADTQTAISAKGLDLANKLDAALASGNQGDMRVELTALYQFFGELKEVLVQLNAAEKAMQSESVGDVLAEVVDTIDGAFGATIPGVHAALQAAQDTFDPSSPGLLNTINGLQAMVTKNLQALYDTYTSYLAADKAGASALSKASHKLIGTRWQNISAESTVSSGWASFVVARATQ